MKKLKLIGILALIIGTILCIQKCFLNPASLKDLEGRINEKFVEVIVYKNNHRGFYLYLNDYNNAVSFVDVLEDEVFKKPDQDSVNFIIDVTSELYDLAEIGDKIEKFPNSNKCCLYKNDSVYKFNLYDITESERKEIKIIDEWGSNEIGYVGKK